MNRACFNQSTNLPNQNSHASCIRPIKNNFVRMKKNIYIFFLGTIFISNANLYGQSNTNCFLNDFVPKTAVIPEAVGAEKPTGQASVIVRLKGDTIGKVSKYVFGNAIAAWAGAHDNPKLVEGTKLLAPTLIRFPGGSWSNGYFWNGVPSDVPDSIYDGTTYNGSTAKKNKFWGQTGVGGWQTTRDQYYTLRKNTNVAQGLITINYGYARYGTSNNPVAQAAHLAADWVRYDAGRTKFWEIGNENGGPWEYGWMIDTKLNKDGQPLFISGELYGKHFKVFVDSMKNAAKQIGDTIYIGGQILASEPTPGYMWYFVDKTWNESFLKEAGDSADFYVVHNYISSSTNVKQIITDAETSLKANMDYIKQDIIKKGGHLKPVALTEYNMGGGAAARASSYVNGMQAVVLICELINNNFGLGARWLLVSGETTMFYGGSDPNYLNHPHAEFYYLTYLQKMYGDHAISTTSSNADIVSYASRFSSGETGMVIVNKGTVPQVITISTDSIGVGGKFYTYSFTGGTDNGDFSQNVYINGQGPTSYQWGPYDQLANIKANSYTIDNEIKFTSPARSVQMIMIEGGTNHLFTSVSSLLSSSFRLNQNSPNPFNSTTLISYNLPVSVFVTLKVFDFQGKEVITLVNEHQNAGDYVVQFNASNLRSGMYFYKIEAGQYHDVKKLIVLK
jgi:hypothetical protein